jgi:hypothetical protein
MELSLNHLIFIVDEFYVSIVPSGFVVLVHQTLIFFVYNNYNNYIINNKSDKFFF